jgi:hemerythrin-like domain-containing protein
MVLSFMNRPSGRKGGPVMHHDKLFEILRGDHARIMDGFQELVKSDSRAHREKLVSDLCVEIYAHMAGEEKAVYPVLDKTGEAWESALKGMEEHHVAKIMLEELLDTPGDDKRFKARGVVLQELLARHIEAEEGQLFSMFTKVVDADEAQGVLDSFQKEKSRKREILAKEPTLV